MKLPLSNPEPKWSSAEVHKDYISIIATKILDEWEFSYREILSAKRNILTSYNEHKNKFVIWLFNGLVNISSVKHIWDIEHEFIQWDKELLSKSLIRRFWFFRKTVKTEKYEDIVKLCSHIKNAHKNVSERVWVNISDKDNSFILALLMKWPVNKLKNEIRPLSIENSYIHWRIVWELMWVQGIPKLVDLDRFIEEYTEEYWWISEQSEFVFDSLIEFWTLKISKKLKIPLSLKWLTEKLVRKRIIQSRSVGKNKGKLFKYWILEPKTTRWVDEMLNTPSFDLKLRDTLSLKQRIVSLKAVNIYTSLMWLDCISTKSKNLLKVRFAYLYLIDKFMDNESIDFEDKKSLLLRVKSVFQWTDSWDFSKEDTDIVKHIINVTKFIKQNLTNPLIETLKKLWQNAELEKTIPSDGVFKLQIETCYLCFRWGLEIIKTHSWEVISEEEEVFLFRIAQYFQSLDNKVDINDDIDVQWTYTNYLRSTKKLTKHQIDAYYKSRMIDALNSDNVYIDNAKRNFWLKFMTRIKDKVRKKSKYI